MALKRIRLGLILPSVNSTMEPEFYAMAPAHVTTHFARTPYVRGDRERFERMAQDLPGAVASLADADVNALALGCTTGSLHGGPGYDTKLTELMHRTASLPCTTTTTAVVDALSALGARRLTVITPYEDWVNERVQSYLTATGFDVLKLANMVGARPADIDPADLCTFARQNLQPGSQAVLLSCTNLRTLAILESLERDVGVPVVSSNSATLWALLRMVDIPATAARVRGTLFRQVA